jgi:hypothetical protein
MIFKEIDNMKDVGDICHYFGSQPDRVHLNGTYFAIDQESKEAHHSHP